MMAKLLGFIVVCIPLNFVCGILDADYYMQSAEDPRLCIEGGAPKQNLTVSKGIFHEGTVGMNICENKVEQQWHFTKQGPHFKNRTELYNITSAASESYISSIYNATITGFFMQFWNNPIELIPRSNETPKEGLFIVKELGQDRCFENSGEGRLLKTSECDLNSLKQTWHFRLVTHGMLN